MNRFLTHIRGMLRDRRTLLIALGLGAAALRLASAWFPGLVESAYSRGFYAAVRVAMDLSFGLAPVPALHLLAALLAALGLGRLLKRRRGRPRPSLGQVLHSLAGALGAAVFLFLALWGFNYGRPPIEDLLGIDARPLELGELEAEARRLGPALEGLRQRTVGAEVHCLETEVGAAVKSALERLGFPAVGKVRGRILWPGAGLMMRFGAGGFYFPFTGEAYVDGGLTWLELPFALAHEMAHGYGFAEEGAANFIAYLACLESGHPALNYSGALAYWSYLMSDLGRASPERRARATEALSAGVRADLGAMAENWRLYRGPLMRAGARINHAYLRSQGVTEGIASYDRLLVLAAAWRRGGR